MLLRFRYSEHNVQAVVILMAYVLNMPYAVT